MLQLRVMMPACVICLSVLSTTRYPDTYHLNGTAERHFTVSLREVQVTDGQVGPLHEDREVAARTLGQVLDLFECAFSDIARGSVR